MANQLPRTTGIIANAVQASQSAGNGVPRERTRVQRLKNILDGQTMRKMFHDVIKDQAPAFIASIIDLYNNDVNLQKCDPDKVIMECLKAATLKLPINKQLGFAWIVPYRDKGDKQIPQFQIG
jgi:recombination protein RecT